MATRMRSFSERQAAAAKKALYYAVKGYMDAPFAPEAVQSLFMAFTTDYDLQTGNVTLSFHGNGNTRLEHEMAKIAFAWLNKCKMQNVFIYGSKVHVTN